MRPKKPELRFIFVNSRPAGGKDTQADLLIDGDPAAFKISPGQLLRESMDPEHRFHRYFRGHHEKVKNGELIDPDALSTILTLIVEQEIAAGKRTIVFTGYPREMRTYHLMEEFLKELRNKNKIHEEFVYIDIDEEDSWKRTARRNEAAVTHGVPFREDDTHSKLQKRLEVFGEQTFPLLQHLAKRGKLIVVDGRGTVQETQRELRGELSWRDPGFELRLPSRSRR